MTSISYIQSLTGSEKKQEIKKLIEELVNEYDKDDNTGKNLYELFDMTKQEWRVHFDFDKKMDIKDKNKFNKEEYLGKIKSKLNYIFDTTNEDWAISEDNRNCRDNKNKKIYKYSYHFILFNKKTTYDYFMPKIKDINKLFKEDDIPFDTSIYRKGITRFRLVLCKKDNEINSLLKPITYEDEIEKHIIQNIYGCENLFIDESKLTQIKNSISSKSTITDILSAYKIISTEVKKGIKFHLTKCICPFVNREHHSNNCRLIEKKDSLEIKCFSEGCKNKVKVLYRKNTDYSLFDVNYFNSIKIKEGKKDNYIERREYFDKHYLYIRNTHTMYNIIYRKTEIGYDRELMEVNKFG